MILDDMNWTDLETRERLIRLSNYWRQRRYGGPRSARTEYAERIIHTFCGLLSFVRNQFMTATIDRYAGRLQLLALLRLSRMTVRRYVIGVRIRRRGQ